MTARVAPQRAPEKVTERRLLDLLAKRHPTGQWAFFRQVRSSTGFPKTPERYADAVALELPPSSGMALHGFEVKVSRADWLRELKEPEKAEAISRYCDFWWLVAAHRDVAEPEELLPSWGLMVLGGGLAGPSELVVVKKAVTCNTAPLDRAFVASLCRNLQRQQDQPAMMPRSRPASICSETNDARAIHCAHWFGEKRPENACAAAAPGLAGVCCECGGKNPSALQPAAGAR